MYEARDDEVWFVKECEVHGIFETLFWQGAEDFTEWNRPKAPQSVKKSAKSFQRGCPFDCGLCGNHQQATCCVLLEVTARCDLRCPVCFASAGTSFSDPALETIDSWYDMLLERGGPFNIQLSGGEPAMRDDLPEIIQLGKEKGFTFFQLNTNGLRIAREPEFLHALKEAGLNTVFLQFDSPFAPATKEIRGMDITGEKLIAIQNCDKEGLGVVLVPTVVRGVSDQDIGAILDFAEAQMPAVRGVHFQPMSYFGRYREMPDAKARITIPELLALMEMQSGGKLKKADFYAGGAEHPLCSFNADYEVFEGVWRPVKKAKKGCCGGQPASSSDDARKAVAEKWSRKTLPADAELGAGFDVSALDAFLEKKSSHTLAISGMAFQDAWTADLERLERCYINIVSPAGDLMPFCAYNLTSVSGDPLHRGKNTSEAVK